MNVRELIDSMPDDPEIGFTQAELDYLDALFVDHVDDPLQRTEWGKWAGKGAAMIEAGKRFPQHKATDVFCAWAEIDFAREIRLPPEPPAPPAPRQVVH